MHRPIAIISGLIFTALLVLPSGCDKASKSIRLRLKLPPGLETVYDFSQRSKGIAMEGDSVISEASHVRTAKYSERVDSLAGDTASWVSVSSIMSSGTTTRNDTTITDTVSDEKQYGYLGQVNGEILTIIPISGVDQEWADNQMEYLKQVQPTFPETDMTVGFTWTKNVKVMLFGETREANGVYTLKSFVRDRGYDCAVIDYEGHYILPVDKQTEEYKVTGASTITTKGTIYFAYREGVLVQDRTWWVINSDRTVKYLTDSKDGKYKAGTEQVVNMVSEGDSQYTLTKVSFPETKQ
jgi:hypothetical protein